MTTMSWTAITFALILFLLTIALVIMKFWPRTDDGKLMDPEEVSKFLDKMPSPGPSRKAINGLMLVFATIALIAMALTKHPSKAIDHHDD